MSKLSNTTWNKTEKIIIEQLPSFAGSFIRSNRDTMKESSLHAYAFDLASFFDYLHTNKSIPVKQLTIRDFKAVTAPDIENYIEYSKYSYVNGVSNKRSDAAVYRRYVILSAFYTFLYKEGMIDSLPILKVAAPYYMKKKPVSAANEDKIALVNFITNENLSSKHAADYQALCRQRDIAIIVLITYAGLRTSECANLDISDLHLKDGYITIKGRRHANLTISSYVNQCVSAYLAERLELIPMYGEEQALFLSLQCRRMSQRSIQIMIKKYSSAALGNEKSVVGKDLSNSFKDQVYNTSKSISTTAILSGYAPNTLYKTYKADLNERIADTAQI